MIQGCILCIITFSNQLSTSIRFNFNVILYRCSRDRERASLTFEQLGFGVSQIISASARYVASIPKKKEGSGLSIFLSMRGVTKIHLQGRRIQIHEVRREMMIVEKLVNEKAGSGKQPRRRRRPPARILHHHAMP